MSLDPIVSLSVAIAEAPGSYAFFLGSGVSRDAGVPTGGEVFWQAVGELYRLEGVSDDTPDEAALRDWLATTDRSALGYSDILELIAPDPATRRDYLAKHFEGVEPGPTHERLAALAADGFVKVFVTTNFDRLLEHALQARGIEPVVVTSEADIEAAPRREHARCYVLKPHGDYLQQTIRNTPAELAALDERMATELQEVFDRYGLIVVGYSGSDEAIAEAVRARRSRYGLYWVARGELAEPARSIVEATGGRVITRPGAAEFLGDLERRLAVFHAHPSGETPLTVHDEVVLLLRRDDRVGLREVLRRERREFEETVEEVIGDRHNERPTGEVALACHKRLLPTLERRLASLLPLLLHDDDLFADEVAGLADIKGRQPVRGGFTFWAELVDWCMWWLGYALGASACRLGRLDSLRPLLAANARERYGGTAPLVQSVSGEAGQLIGQAVMQERDDRNWLAPAWEALTTALRDVELLQERYAELVARDDEPRRSLVEFDFLLGIALGLREFRAAAHWNMNPQEAGEFARRLHGDSRLRRQAAEAVGVTLEEFDEKAPGALRETHAVGRFPHRDAVSVLESGSET